jgi:hypothetical protein
MLRKTLGPVQAMILSGLVLLSGVPATRADAQEAAAGSQRDGQPGSRVPGPGARLPKALKRGGVCIRLIEPRRALELALGNPAIAAYLETSSGRSILSWPEVLKLENGRLELEQELRGPLPQAGLIELAGSRVLLCRLKDGEWIAVSQPDPDGSAAQLLLGALGAWPSRRLEVGAGSRKLRLQSLQGLLAITSTAETPRTLRPFLELLQQDGPPLELWIRSRVLGSLLGRSLAAGVDWRDGLRLWLEGAGEPGEPAAGGEELLRFLPYGTAAAVLWRAPWYPLARAQLLNTFAATAGEDPDAGPLAAPLQDAALEALGATLAGPIAVAFETGRTHAGRFYPASVLAVSLADPAAAEPRLLALFGACVKAPLRQSRAGEVTVHHVGDRNGLSPAFAVAGSVALLSPDVRGIEDALARLADRPSLADRWVPGAGSGALWLDAHALGATLLERAEKVVAVDASYSSADVQYGLRPLVELLRHLNQGEGTFAGRPGGWRMDLDFRVGAQAGKN